MRPESDGAPLFVGIGIGVATALGAFKFEPAPQGVRVTWTMAGTRDFMGRPFAFFVDVDKVVAGDFEKGLAAVRPLAEAQPPGNEVL